MCILHMQIIPFEVNRLFFNEDNINIFTQNPAIDNANFAHQQISMSLRMLFITEIKTTREKEKVNAIAKRYQNRTEPA